MNTKQLAAEDENFPSLLSELSEHESAGGQLFSLAKERGRRGCEGETSYNPPSTASEERTSTLSQGEK